MVRLHSRLLAAVLVSVLVLAGCIVPAPSGDAPGPSTSPPLSLLSGANFGGKVELQRAVFRPGRPAAGEPVHVALTLRVLAEVPDDYVLFVHVEDGGGKAERRNADHRPVDGSRPSTSWKPGEILVDEFTVEAPVGSTRLLNIWMGFWQPERDVRLPVVNPERVRTDGHDRVLIGQLPLVAS